MECTIEGTRFVEVSTITLERHAWMIRWAAKAGLADVTRLAPPESPAEAQDAIRAMVQRAFAEDAVMPLLAGMLAPEGTKWTRAGAEQWQHVIGAADEATSELLLEGFAGMVVGFLQRAPAFWESIGPSLPTDLHPDARANGPAPSSPTLTPEDSTPSPGKSQAMIPSDST